MLNRESTSQVNIKEIGSQNCIWMCQSTGEVEAFFESPELGHNRVSLVNGILHERASDCCLMPNMKCINFSAIKY